MNTRVKQAILNVKGDYTSNPDELHEEISLVDHLEYTDVEYVQLAMELNKLLSDDNEKITEEEMNNCETVADCIVLVNKKLNT